MNYALAIVGFMVLIVLHELGHFVAAKKTGMKVERFALFFPPLLFKVRRGETEYGVGAIPLGGYVRITGMTPLEELSPEDRRRAYYRQPVWKRIVVIAAGPAVNIVIAVVLVAGLYAVKGEPRTEVTSKVGVVTKDSPADGRLEVGDRLVSVDGVTGAPEKLRAQLATHRCAGAQKDGCPAKRPAAIAVDRGGERVHLSITPKYDAEAERPLIGFAYDAERRYTAVPFGEAVGDSLSTNWRVTRETVTTLAGLFTSEQKRKEVSGVVGSVEVTKQSFDFDTAQAIFVLALISLSLGIINLFPFLPLDGGHIFWALAELVRGRRVPFSVIEKVSVVGFVLIAFLFTIGLTNDIDRLSNEGFNVK